MPFKHKASLRYHIGKMKLRMTNRLDYEAGLHRRRSLSLWITRKRCRAGRRRSWRHAVESRAIPIWHSITRLPLGLVLDRVCDRRRALFRRSWSWKSPWSWRKLHLVLDAGSGGIVAHVM